MWVGTNRRESTSLGKKMLNSSRDKIRAGTVVGKWEGSPLYDPGSKLYYWEGESNASITMSEMGKKKKWRVLLLLE